MAYFCAMSVSSNKRMYPEPIDFPSGPSYSSTYDTSEPTKTTAKSQHKTDSIMTKHL